MNSPITLLITIFTLFAPPTHAASEANWVLIGKTETMTIKIDKSSLKRNGDLVTAWESYVDAKDKKSTKILSEYNCKTNQSKGLSVSVYPTLDFTGRPITYPPQKDWSYVVRETIGEDMINYVCKNTPKGLMDYFK